MSRKPRGVPLPTATVSPAMLAKLKEYEGARVRATGKPCSTQDAIRILIWIGLETVSRCVACAAGLACSIHEPPKEEDAPAVDGRAWQSVVDRYFRLFREAGRGDPVFSGPDQAAMKRLIAAVGAEETIALLDKAASIPFHAATITIQTLAKDPSRALQGSTSAPPKRAAIQRDSGFRGQDE